MPTIAEIDDELVQLYDAIIEDIKAGKDITTDSRITELYASVFNEAIEKGYGKKLSNQKKGSLLFKRLKAMQQNAYDFAEAKQKRYIKDLERAIELPAEEFGLFKEMYHFTQNRTWLAAENEMIAAHAQMAERWHQMETITTLPNLRYETVGDDRVRPAHVLLDRINKPMNDPFWETHYPPLGFGCRCDVQQNDDPVTEGEVPKTKHEKGFGFNSGLTNTVVGADHPYFEA